MAQDDDLIARVNAATVRFGHKSVGGTGGVVRGENGEIYIVTNAHVVLDDSNSSLPPNGQKIGNAYYYYIHDHNNTIGFARLAAYGQEWLKDRSKDIAVLEVIDRDHPDFDAVQEVMDRRWHYANIALPLLPILATIPSVTGLIAPRLDLTPYPAGEIRTANEALLRNNRDLYPSGEYLAFGYPKDKGGHPESTTGTYIASNYINTTTNRDEPAARPGYSGSFLMHRGRKIPIGILTAEVTLLNPSKPNAVGALGVPILPVLEVVAQLEACEDYRNPGKAPVMIDPSPVIAPTTPEPTAPNHGLPPQPPPRSITCSR